MGVIRHGGTTHTTQTREYKSWAAMLNRCRNERHANWRYYGGRGIKVCERWRDFSNFLADMGFRPMGCSLERINNDGDYEPSNCRWATRAEQLANRRPYKKRVPDSPETRERKRISHQAYLQRRQVLLTAVSRSNRVTNSQPLPMSGEVLVER